VQIVSMIFGIASSALEDSASTRVIACSIA
jgi:hypothetical protein